MMGMAHSAAIEAAVAWAATRAERLFQLRRQVKPGNEYNPSGMSGAQGFGEITAAVVISNPAAFA